VKTQRQLERVYRQAASALLEVQDLREVMGRRELYRRVSRISETLTEAADRAWYATVKEGCHRGQPNPSLRPRSPGAVPPKTSGKPSRRTGRRPSTRAWAPPWDGLTARTADG
jgi:hypothetical protein